MEETKGYSLMKERCNQNSLTQLFLWEKEMVTGYLQSTENLSAGIWWSEYNLILMVVGLFVLGGFFQRQPSDKDTRSKQKFA